MAWLLWSGLYKPLLLALGAFSCLITVYLARRMGYFENDLFALRFGPRLFHYWGWLAKEVVRSSMEVTRIVLDPRLPISPQVVDVKATCKHPVSQALLGNSITLTPGTLTVDLHNGVIKVHCLTRSGAEGLMAGEMDRRVAALEEN
ncbi:sodium:proton antiporter [Exilibacterium tricleocarpae]|uniref:Sodium:proton antiporter n=1 Tax=Exilibacterium tricleocarpae TaxID=2591008 RepID=A0A545SZ39_9GAMM|nr:sodium:proton antiporter [Exilibacterium tricleocarpae]